MNNMLNHKRLSLMNVLEHNDEIIQQIQLDQLVHKIKAKAIEHEHEAELNKLCETIVPHNSTYSPSSTCSSEFQNLLSEFNLDNAELTDCDAVDTNDAVCQYNYPNLCGYTTWGPFSQYAFDDKFTQLQKHPSLSKYSKTKTIYPFKESERDGVTPRKRSRCKIQLEKLNEREALFTAQRERSNAFDETPIKKRRVKFADTTFE